MFCVRIGSIGIYIYIDSHWGVLLFERIRMVRCGLVGGNIPLEVDFEFSKAYARPRLSFFQPVDQDLALGNYSSTIHAAMLSTMRTMD